MHILPLPEATQAWQSQRRQQETGAASTAPKSHKPNGGLLRGPQCLRWAADLTHGTSGFVPGIDNEMVGGNFCIFGCRKPESACTGQAVS